MSTDSNLPPEPPEPEESQPSETPAAGGEVLPVGRIVEMPIEEELKGSYLTYAMSVIVSRALPDVRDGLKPSQRRILVAMNDLNLTPGASRVKCAKISGDTSGNYHPHGESVIYPTLVRMAQEWNMRHVLVDKQGNFGSIAGLPPAAMRYTEARMSAIAALMMDDLKLDTVDFIPTYDERRTEPTVLPSRFPNLLVNGANGIAVGMATSIPPHNLGEICDAMIRVIDEPEVSIDELLEIVPGPDFPTGGVVCGRSGIRRGYHTGRSTIVVRARARIEEHNNRYRIVVTEIPFQQARDRIEERIAALVNEGKIAGISGIRNESDLKEPVRLVCELKRDADPDIVLNQLYQFSPLQDSFSLIFLALVDGKPRVLSFKELLQEFIRHRETVIRRRTQFLLGPGAAAKAHRRRPAAGPRQHRRSDPRDPQFVDPGRGQRAADADPDARRHVAAGAGRRRFCRLHGRSRPGRVLHAHARPGRRHPADDPRPIGQPGARKALRRASQAAGGNHRAPPHPLRPAEHSGHHSRRLPRVEAEARRRPPHGNQRRRGGRARHGGPDHRRDDGRLDQQQRLHQADARLGLSRPAPRRQGPDGGENRRGRPDPAPVRRQHPRLSAVFHQQGQGLLAQGVRPAAVGPRRPRPRRGEPAEPRRGRADYRLPGGPRFRPPRPFPGHGHGPRTGEEDAAGGLQPPVAERHHRHQAPRGRRAGRRGGGQAGRRVGAGHGPRHGHPFQAVGRPRRWAATPAA